MPNIFIIIIIIIIILFYFLDIFWPNHWEIIKV